MYYITLAIMIAVAVTVGFCTTMWVEFKNRRNRTLDD